MTNPKVSIVMPCLNYGQFLPEAIDSVLEQTYGDFELIIVDDGSDDGTTPAVIAEQAKRDERIKAITHSKNKGAGAARNTGIKEAKGEYIVGVDSDDMIDPSFLEKMIAKMESTGADVVYTHFKVFGNKNRVYYYSADQKKIKKSSPHSGCFPMWCLYKKSDYLAFGGYDETMAGLEDWDFWLYFVEADKNFVLLDEIVYFYRIHGNSLSDRVYKIKPEVIKKMKQNHPKLYRSFNYYFSFKYVKYVLRPALFQLRTRKGRRLFRLLGITFYKD